MSAINTRPHSRPSTKILAILALPCFVPVAATSLAAAASAQIPNNSAVISRFQGGGTASPLGGLSLVGLDGTAGPIDITGLSTELTGSSSGSGAVEGAASVLVDDRTGQLIVGEHALAGDDTDIHVLTLSGTAVVLDQRYPLGSASGGGGWTDQMGWLNGDIVFSIRGGNIDSGPMVGHRLGILRPQLGPPGTAGTVQPVPFTSNPTGFINALAVDEANGTAYFSANQPGTTDIYSVPVPGDGTTPVTPAFVATIPSIVLNMAIAPDGKLVVGTNNASSARLFEVDISLPTATVTPVLVAINDINGMTAENVSGDLLLAESSSGTIRRRRPDGTLSTVASVAANASGIAIHQRLGTYGKPTPGLNHYEWSLLPGIGNAPYLGNSGFELVSVASPGAPVLSLNALSFARASLPALGLEVLVDPLAAVIVNVPAGATSSYPLPLPVTASLAGALITAQGVHVEANGALASSRGLAVTLAVMPPPTIDSVVPGAATAGTTVTVTGTHFYGGLTLDIDGNPTAIASQERDELTFVMPAGVACDATIQLSNAAGLSATGTLNGTPMINTSTPQGPAAGGALLVITGTNLDTAVVTINGVALTTVTSQTANVIVGFTPAGAPGAAVVRIDGPTGCFATASYTYL